VPIDNINAIPYFSTIQFYPMKRIHRFILIFTCISLSHFSFAQTDSSDYYLKKGIDEKTKGRLMESYKAFDKAYNFNKNNEQVVAELAKTLFDLRRYAQAKEKYLQLESMGNRSVNTYNQLLTLSYTARQYSDIIKYAQLVKKTDASAKTAFYIAKAHYDQENYGDAIKFFSIASGEDPTNKEVPYLVARSYADMNNFRMAIPFFEEALALDPNNARMTYELALMYYALPDDKKSLEYILLAAERGLKRDNEYLENLAVALLNNKQTDKGLTILTEALQRRPSDLSLLNMVAEANYEAKRYDDAIKYWNQALSYDKQNAAALYMIGMSYQKKGDKQKGIALCDKAIEMDPSLAKNRQKMEMPGGM